MAKRIDANQPAIVAELRKMGYSVACTHMVGDGFPDIVVGANGRNYLFEIKDPTSTRWVKHQKKKLIGSEKEFHKNWQGPVSVIECADDAVTDIRNYRAFETPAEEK